MENNNQFNLFARNRHIPASEKPKDQVAFDKSGYTTKLDWLSAGCKAKPVTPKPDAKKVIPNPTPKSVEAVAQSPVIPVEKKVLPDLKPRKDIVVQDDEDEAETIISESDVDDADDEEISETDQQQIETLKGETKIAIENLTENLEKIKTAKKITDDQKTEILQSYALLVGAMSTTNDYQQTYSNEQIGYFNTMFIYVEDALKINDNIDDIIESLDETISEFNSIK
jgi:hypothetical protein